jgi:hypothetical protein
VVHIIKKQDGTIREKNSFGNDPFPPEGNAPRLSSRRSV